MQTSLDIFDNSSFSKSADQTYKHLKTLTKLQWNTFGLYEFDINFDKGFLLQGELDKENGDN